MSSIGRFVGMIHDTAGVRTRSVSRKWLGAKHW